MYTNYYKSPVGDLLIKTDDSSLLELRFDVSDVQSTGVNEVAEKLFGQLDEYFAGTRREFDVPVKLFGTVFQLAVWAELMQIPYGQTITYGQLAAKLGKPKAVRAVGGANHVNPISIVIPCHRVIGANGKLTGYGGGLEIKEFLLNLEQ